MGLVSSSPTGNLFMQANWSTILYNWESQTTTQLPFMTHAVRVYPGQSQDDFLSLRPFTNSRNPVFPQPPPDPPCFRSLPPTTTPPPSCSAVAQHLQRGVMTVAQGTTSLQVRSHRQPPRTASDSFLPPTDPTYQSPPTTRVSASRPTLPTRRTRTMISWTEDEVWVPSTTCQMALYGSE